MVKNSWVHISLKVGLTLCAALSLFMISVSAVTVTDQKSGITYSVPEGWEQDPPSNIGFSLVPEPDTGEVILYELEKIEDRIKNRSDGQGKNAVDANKDAYSKSDAVKILGWSEHAISEATYHGVLYYEYSYMSDTDYSDKTVFTKCVFHFGGGSVFEFVYQYTGAGKNSHESDFTAFLNSVTYPKQAAGSAFSNSSFYRFSQTELGGFVIFAAFYFSIFIPFFIYRHKTKKRPIPPKNAGVYSILYFLFTFGCLWFGYIELFGLDIHISRLIVLLVPAHLSMYRTLSKGYKKEDEYSIRSDDYSESNYTV